ncbi:MAG: YitT family protein [Spirochaetales bacterium]|nr:YitT family protein [Spirochaetales bacterium]MBO4717565.1 YitT family protein [Spirochaetales bacterium]
MNTKAKMVLDYLIVTVIAVLGALNFQVFVFPNNFAPSGLNGILTIIRHVFGINFGMLYLFLNIPLLIAAFYVLRSKKYAIATFIYVVVFSVSSILLRNLDLSKLMFSGGDGGERIMAAVAAGVFSGFNYSVAIRLGGCTGGLDIVAALVIHKKPSINLVWLVFGINVGVATLSFFAYGMDYAPVILCIIYSFVTSRIGDLILKGARTAAKFEIITSNPEELSQALMSQLHHGCTVLPARGMYSHTDKSLLICVVNRRQIADFERVLRNFEDTFVVVTPVTRTYGNFKHIK